MINCDTNGTEGTFSVVDDIFTLCRDHGAQAALLYSLTSQVRRFSRLSGPGTEHASPAGLPDEQEVSRALKDGSSRSGVY